MRANKSKRCENESSRMSEELYEQQINVDKKNTIFFNFIQTISVNFDLFLLEMLRHR